jgi:hypothetical protein
MNPTKLAHSTAKSCRSKWLGMNFERPVFGPGPVLWIGVVQEGNKIMATVGRDLVVGAAGCGNTIPDALRDLAAALDRQGVLIGPLGKQQLHLITPPQE